MSPAIGNRKVPTRLASASIKHGHHGTEAPTLTLVSFPGPQRRSCTNRRGGPNFTMRSRSYFLPPSNDASAPIECSRTDILWSFSCGMQLEDQIVAMQSSAARLKGISPPTTSRHLSTDELRRATSTFLEVQPAWHKGRDVRSMRLACSRRRHRECSTHKLH